MRFYNGDVVELTPSCRAVNANPEKYERGIVTDDRGYWGVYEVQWNGIDHPIGMRSDEIQRVSNAAL